MAAFEDPAVLVRGDAPCCRGRAVAVDHLPMAKKESLRKTGEFPKKSLRKYTRGIARATWPNFGVRFLIQGISYSGEGTAGKCVNQK